MQEIALFSARIYTTGKNFTQPPVMAVATNFKSGLNNINQWVSCESVCRNGSLGNCGSTEHFGQHPSTLLCNISVTWVVKYRFHLVGQLTSSTLHHRDDMEVAIANLKAPNIVKWDIPEKIMQNAFQLYWPWVNRTSHSKVMTKSLFLFLNQN